MAGALVLVYFQQSVALVPSDFRTLESLRETFYKVFVILFAIAAVATWWLVLSNESRQVAQEESNRQTVLLTQEIAAHQRTDAALQEAKETAERANRAKSRFLTAMSHELRTPLNSILGFAQLLQKQVDANAPEGLAVIRRSGEHLLTLIDGLLDIAKIEAGRMQLSHDQVDLPRFLHEVAQMFRHQARAKGLDFELETRGRLPATVRTDERRLRQILINLLGNAVKFTPRGGVTLRCFYQAEMGRFEIEDTGIGMSASELQRVFEPFEQGTDPGSPEAKMLDRSGAGLGLSITRLLVELMGGDITVKSVAGAGTLFQVRVFLPEVREPRPARQPARGVMGYHGARRRILVVDDEAAHRIIMESLLGGLGFQVSTCASGEACLTEFGRHSFDLVLLDIAMPGMSGWDTASALREQTRFNGPIVVVSASGENHDHRIIDANLQGFVGKPVNFDELLDRLGRVLNLEWRYETQTAVALTHFGKDNDH